MWHTNISFKLNFLLFSLLLVACGPKTGIECYTSFETRTVDKNNYQVVHADSLITFQVNVYSMSYEQDVYVHLVSNITAGESLVLDSLSANILFPLSKDTANYKLRKYFIQSNDSNITFLSNGDSPAKIRGFKQRERKTEYELDYYDKTRNGIPKTVKQMKIEIFIQYKLGQKNYVRKFNVALKSRNHLFVQLIPKC